MTWTYNPSQTTDKDIVRFKIQDTDTNDQLLSDEEIAAVLTQTGSVNAAAIASAEAIARKFARLATSKSFSTGQRTMTVSYADRVTAYQSLAADLRKQTARAVSPYLGGQSITEKDTINDDTDRTTPKFRRDWDKEPGLPSNIREESELR